MNLILIYGPPAAGKLTVAQELARQTGYRLIDNHRATDYISELFPRDMPNYDSARTTLGRKIRLLLFEAAAHNDVNLITTFAPISAGRHDSMRDIIRTVESANGHVYLVQVLPSKATLEARVTSESRKGTKADTVERLHELMEQHPAMFDTFPDRDHTVIDNSELEPEAVARQITTNYHL